MKLNLGCGDKILPGYVNVDVAETRAGRRPDVLCDLHALTRFEDNSVDEILSVHVVEHFWRWEVVGVLKEWDLVLKAGGLMVLECPNLKSACEAFLANPDLQAGPGRPALDVGVLRRSQMARSAHGAPLGLYAAQPRRRDDGGRPGEHPPGAGAVQAARAAGHAHRGREAAGQSAAIAGSPDDTGMKSTLIKNPRAELPLRRRTQ